MDTPFELNPNTSTQVLTAGVASSSITLPAGCAAVRIYNGGANTAYLAAGDTSIAATTAGVPIPPGLVEVFGVAGMKKLAAITLTGTAALSVSAGWGS
jgi:hypothetical protein